MVLPLLGGFASSAYALNITFNTSDSQLTSGNDNQGYYTYGGGSDADNDNYSVGTTGSLRNFFSCDLSGLSSPVTSATLKLRAGRNNWSLGDAASTLDFYDVSTDVNTLNSGVKGAAAAPIYRDLGPGDLYALFLLGSGFDLSFTDENAILEYVLNATAIADINSAAGG